MRRRKYTRRKRQTIVSIILDLILILGIGYALIQSNLSINGTANMGAPTWNIHWANVQVKEGSVSASTPTINSAQTTVTYSVVLNIPGDYYEFTVDAVNSGTIDGMIESITSKLNGVTITNLPDYLRYTVTYSSGVPLATNQILAAGTTEKYRVRIEYRTDIELNQIPSTNQSLPFQFTVKYKQADTNATTIDHSFANQSWETIIDNVRSGNTSNYNVGDTKTVDMGSLGIHTIRIANKTTPSECSTEGFSQTACGFVLEFEDIITTHRMNPWNPGVTTSGNGNVGGWPASEMRTYVNNNIYNALPTELKSGIINTTVVSGHGSSDSTNFTSTDKMYLLSTKEVWGKEGTTNVINNDTAEAETRQLDYYSSQNVTTSSYAGAIKQNHESNDYWWLRSARSDFNSVFFSVNQVGWWNGLCDFNGGVSPAFRIG